MTSGNVERLKMIFLNVLELEDITDFSMINQASFTTWDSMVQITLIAAIESEFNITLDISDMERMSSFAEAQMLLEEKGL